MKTALFVGLGLVAIPYLLALTGAAARARAARDKGEESVHPSPLELAIGFHVANFFDTLGIGSFATHHRGLQAQGAWCATSGSPARSTWATRSPRSPRPSSSSPIVNVDV